MIATVKPKLTKRQQEVLTFVMRYMRMHNVPPSVRDICKELDVYQNAVLGHLLALRQKGVMTWEYDHSRTLELAFPAKGDNFRTLSASEVRARIAGDEVVDVVIEERA